MHSSRMRTVRCSGRRGGLPGGVSAWGGCLPGRCTPPPVDRMTDACENITFSQLLSRTVTIEVLTPWYAVRDRVCFQL